MRLLWVIADAAHLDQFKSALREAGAAGWTISPVIEGAGRTGVHTADRIHPGALVSIVCVTDDSLATRLFDALQTARDLAGDLVTRLFLLPVERQA